jgi:hypothetical protein
MSELIGTKSLIDRMGLNLKRQLKNPTMIGDMILKNKVKRAPVASKREQSLYDQSEYGLMLQDSINDGCRKFHRHGYRSDFYLEVTYCRDKILHDLFKMIPRLRNSASLPFWDKDLFMYNSTDKKLELLWGIPCRFMCENPHLVPLETENRSKLMETIQNFNSGLYLEVYKKLIAKGEKR